MRKLFLSLLFIITGITCLFSQNPERVYQSHSEENGIFSVTTNDGKYLFTFYSTEILETTFIPNGEETNANSHAVILQPNKVETNYNYVGNDITYGTEGLSVIVTTEPFKISYTYNDNPLISEKRGYYKSPHESMELVKDHIIADASEKIEFNLTEEEVLYGGGSRALGMNRRGHRLPLYNRAQYGYQSYSELLNFTLPIVLSSKKYMLHFDNSTIGYLDLDSKKQAALHAITTAQDIKTLEEIRVEYLGKKGQFTEVLKSLGGLSAKERPKMGQRINEIKQLVQTAINTRREALQHTDMLAKLEEEYIDVTLAGRVSQSGHEHPVSQALDRIESYFIHHGFVSETGPEIEDDYHNFTALNLPDNHPARASHDTFYFGDGRLLRTHTSGVQIRTMENAQPPFRVIAPGRVYRCDSDQTHTPMFHQVEGLLVDKCIHFGHLKAVLADFLHYFFDREIEIRFRPSYFPFTEPSAEVDVKFNGKWLEVLGCGMVHPHVFVHVNIDSEMYNGFAFGLGVERLAMILYGIDDLRLFFHNDLRFLKQF